jgi:oligoendopeptidase F
MSVAETASNLNQVLLRASVLKAADRSTSLAVLEEAFFFAHRYLFLMPTMSEVEHKLHTTCANGGALSATDLSNEVVRAFSEAYGGEVEFEPARLGVKWAKFCHFYSPYYFFQYAIGISAANSIGRRILGGEPGIVEKYLKFLAAGGSDYPTEIFKIVDIDITSTETYRAAFKVVEGYVERLEGYVGSYTPLSLSI